MRSHCREHIKPATALTYMWYVPPVMSLQSDWNPRTYILPMECHGCFMNKLFRTPPPTVCMHKLGKNSLASSKKQNPTGELGRAGGWHLRQTSTCYEMVLTDHTSLTARSCQTSHKTHEQLKFLQRTQSMCWYLCSGQPRPDSKILSPKK